MLRLIKHFCTIIDNKNNFDKYAIIGFIWMNYINESERYEMKNVKLKKVITSLLLVVSVLALNPIRSSAEWKQDSNGWQNTEGNSKSVGWKSIDGKRYYFDNNGYMKTGWIQYNSKWYYLDLHGIMQTGWIQVGGEWYYFNIDGDMKSREWLYSNGNWYYLNHTGDMRHGWLYVERDNKYYYFNEDGTMRTTSITLDGDTYNFNEDGSANLK